MGTEPTQIQEPVFLDEKTGKPLTGKALKKAKRAALVNQRPENNKPEEKNEHVPKSPAKIQPVKNTATNRPSTPAQPQKGPIPKNNQKPPQAQKQNNQKQAKNPRREPRQQKHVFANIRREFNFTDDTQR